MTSARVLVSALGLLAVVAFHAEPRDQRGLSPEEVITKAAANEEKLKAAEPEYQYRQDILVQVFGEARSVRAQLHRVSEFTYDDLGNRVERIIEYPRSPLTSFLGIQRPDFKSLLGVDPFFLTTKNLAAYSAKYVEKQKVDELSTYVFEVKPISVDGKKNAPGERFFKGRVWIDDQDLQLVKAEGKTMVFKDDRERFPKFEYYREYVDDKVWLPGFVVADDVLEFPRYDLPIRVTIKYSEYRKAQKRG